MNPSSIKLFGAWSAKHKEVIALEDQLAQARAAGADTGALEEQLQALRVAAEGKLQAAMARFREEIGERGLTR